MEIKTLVLGEMQTNCYLVSSLKSAVIIDPAVFTPEISEFLNSAIKNKKEALILLTHAHFDHIGGAEELKNRYGVKIAIGKPDEYALRDKKANLSQMFGANIEPFYADIKLKNNEIITVGDLEIKTVLTAGHTVGGAVYIINGVMFSGDTLFFESIGNDRFFGGNGKDLIKSVKFLLNEFPEDMQVYTGHGRPTTIGHERKYNPYIEL